ncbi:uroporphyrinogen-III synthase [Salicibibacter kimchii]|uniref:Uroporphyrinogen-III synthase n=1 Tax=Salicibibacter kimchii TaxID=2099786 RepID=A0A345BXW8_9BACI|nr:uroporphyrinogen-III synthase [Salicibibacter kimchii]AXF55799.1 uroporphyrinogen-III synthase [Salicibibacter kimchii]
MLSSAPVALVTRGQADQTDEDPLVSQLQALSLPMQHIPLVKQQMRKNHETIPDPYEVDWLVFTSANAVCYFDCLMFVKKWIDANVHVAAVGPKTAEAVASLGFTVDLFPEKTYTAEALADALAAVIRPGDTVVIPKSKQARKVLPNYLNERGANVVDPAIYETKARTENAHDLAVFFKGHDHGVITFTSPSAVHAFKQMQPDLPMWPAICIGTITATAATEAGFSQVDAAFPHTFASLAARVSNYMNEVNTR